ncbi:hypothetical protein [Fluviicola sp.]|uniref:hypothetical protein n=1 Tax=Fluviicola sp. TaxID=1917219 RepID=UPI00260D98E0|nr:hypothetical protein [Fluviicola sp.]
MNHEHEFQAYQTFQSKDEFNDFVLLLNEYNIDFETEDYPINFISDIRNDRFSHEYIVKLKSEDFSVADKIQEELALEQLEDIPSDYYLFEFTNEELIDILEAKDEWSKLDYVLALDILKQRGITVSDKALSMIQMERIEKLSEPEKHSPVWIAIGYTSAALGGLLGIMIGWHLYNAKKVLPNGERVPVYAQTDRNQGFRIFVIGIIVLLIAVTIRIVSHVP